MVGIPYVMLVWRGCRGNADPGESVQRSVDFRFEDFILVGLDPKVDEILNLLPIVRSGD